VGQLLFVSLTRIRRAARDFDDYPPASFKIVEASEANKMALSAMAFFHIAVIFCEKAGVSRAM